MGRPFVSIVLPCLNEEATVATCVRKARGWLERSGYEGEVIVVDNGSSDRSAELAAEAGAHVVQEARRGYGAALRRGFAEARGAWLIMGDCDDTYELSELDPLVEALAGGADLAVGDRYAGGIATGAMSWSHRYVGTPMLTLLLEVVAGLRVRDSQCGLRALTREALDRLELRSDGMELASEMVLKAARRGLVVADVPVPYAARIGEAKLHTVRDGWRHLRLLILASPNHLFTVPGAAFALAGILTLALSLPAKGIEIGDRRWQPVFAGGIFVVVGMNALLLGFASRLYTTAIGVTNEDAMLRFYNRYLGLETCMIAGAASVAAGFLIDLLLALVAMPSFDRVDVAAIAQTLIIVGANIVLVGALASLLAGVRDGA